MPNQNCSTFNCDRINKLIAYYNQQSKHFNFPEKITNYEDFCNKIPICRDVDLTQQIESSLRLGLLTNCTFTTSSATSGDYKLLAQRLGRIVTPTPDNYPYQLVVALGKLNVFNASDIVANLLSAGGMSMLFDGGNRILELLNASVLPIGRLDTYPQAQSAYLKMMADLSVNTLFGTPSSIMQCANATHEAGLKLNIKKVVFVGETFTDVKRAYTQKFFPDMRVYGLYGQSETGVVGFHTPNCHADYYHILSDFFFIETTAHGEILITDLSMPLVPLFRYYVGDMGELKTGMCACNTPLPVLSLKGRSDKKFNYMGNLISYEKIKKIIASHYGKILDVQIQLTSDKLGNDLLNVVIDDNELSLSKMKETLINDLSAISEINEGIKKGVGKINILSRDKFTISHRQKIPLIFDTRLDQPVSHFEDEMAYTT